ncbi:WxL protein peptidoglycan domain-containing protein [Micromonospora cathayae]|uniref:DUF916 domain-containing protein n=1 Tax=Micromonospora cathayae TaxID=3028804 RepID=A0ABY7ZNF8_9ACTN|nr:DUF916 domain-containing protein [Micromonospora sp. HUAS 3]WDZ83757.1 DUF916 domain-containing protein [Micromonospora sp. HUAS 3]
MKNRSWLRVFALLAAVLVGLPALPAGAVRAAPATPSVTWAVQPADRNGPDGRRWVERTLDPGQVVTEHLAVRNFSDAPVVFSLKAADGYLTDKGRFNMLPSHQKSVDGGTWITVQETVTVGPKSTRVVPFTITVPADATPGDHPAGIAATVTSTGGTVAVESRVGFRVLLRATGTVAAALTVTDLTATYRPTWNPFAAGTLQVRYTAVNDGGVAVTGTGRVTAAGLFGLGQRDVRADVEELLPGGRREGGARVGGVWGWGPVRTTVELTPAVRGGDPTGIEIRPGRTTVTVWAVPWAQLALLVLLAALVLAYRGVARRRRRRLALLLARARDEGRQEGREAVRTAGTAVPD